MERADGEVEGTSVRIWAGLREYLYFTFFEGVPSPRAVEGKTPSGLGTEAFSTARGDQRQRGGGGHTYMRVLTFDRP